MTAKVVQVRQRSTDGRWYCMNTRMGLQVGGTWATRAEAERHAADFEAIYHGRAPQGGTR